MRIVTSLLAFRPGRIGGTETYLRNLLERMPAEARPGDTLALVMDRDLAAALPTRGFERIVVPKSARRVVVERVLEAFTPYRARDLERLFRDLRPDVAFFPQISMFPRRVEAPAVVTVLDVQHLVFPEYFARFDRAFRPRIYPYSMAKARKLVAISEFTKAEIVARCGIAAEKIVAVPLGTTPLDLTRIAPYPGLEEPYLYYPAVTLPHKNHATLLETYAALRRAGKMPYRLVLSGIQTKLWRALARKVEALGIAADVRHLGYLSYGDVRRVYAGAAAVVFPTQYEGFGLPVTEAVEHGKKVIVSDIPMFEELGVPRRWRIDFADPDELARALALPGPTVLERPTTSWAECARRTIEILRSVGSGGGELP